jgi:large conductance mechanosensitive channel
MIQGKDNPSWDSIGSIFQKTFLIMTFVSEFKEFLKEYKILGLAIAFIMGAAVTDLVKSLVTTVIMPIVTFFIPGGAWEEATFTLGAIVISWGAFLAALINFTIIALVVFIIAKMVLKEDKVSKK